MSIPPQAAQPCSRVPGELVSALMDGQLRGPLLAQTVQDCTRDLEARQRWDEYHLIGEALRFSQAQGGSLAASSPAFLTRLQRRLTDENSLPVALPE